MGRKVLKWTAKCVCVSILHYLLQKKEQSITCLWSSVLLVAYRRHGNACVIKHKHSIAFRQQSHLAVFEESGI